jgi:hypothetical protein
MRRAQVPNIPNPKDMHGKEWGSEAQSESTWKRELLLACVFVLVFVVGMFAGHCGAKP